jgi:hypothetical protein
MVLARQSGWITKIYPIEYTDPQGVHRATWPARFPLKWVEEKREEFQSLGLQAEFSKGDQDRHDRRCCSVRRPGPARIGRLGPRTRAWSGRRRNHS